MSLAIKPVMRSLVRLGLTLGVGSSLALTLGLLYPIQRELDLARYSYPSYTNEVQGVFPEVLEPAIARAISGDACFVSEWKTELTAAGTPAGPTELDALSPTCGPVSRFPARSLVQSGPSGPEWIDLSADTADALDVGPGDSVSVAIGPGVAPVPLSVRNIYAVRGSLEFAAQAPASVLFARLPPDAQPGYGLVLTRTPAATLLAGLDTSPAKTELARAKGYPPVVTGVPDLLAATSKASSHSLGLVRTIGTLCGIGISLLALRELDVFRRQTAPVLLHVHRLGGPARRLLAHVFALATGTVLMAVTAGALVAAAGYRFGWVASCLPPTIIPLLLTCWAAFMGLCACVGALMARTTGRQAGL